MPVLQRALVTLLQSSGTPVGLGAARPSVSDVKRAGLLDPLMEVYHHLGGKQSLPRVAPGSWDASLGDTLIELDEAQHFNRYRAATLQSDLYEATNSPWRQRYLEYSSLHEIACLQVTGSRKGFWTSVSAEREFGVAGPIGDLEGNGSPRWKQRAFYDFVKDMSPLITPHRVARIAVWDVLHYAGMHRTVADVLGHVWRGDRALDGWLRALVAHIGA